MSEEHSSKTRFQRAISAFAGSFLTALLGMNPSRCRFLTYIVTPLDVIRVRLQTQSTVQITGTFDGLLKIARHEGPRKLWRGLGATLYRLRLFLTDRSLIMYGTV